MIYFFYALHDIYIKTTFSEQIRCEKDAWPLSIRRYKKQSRCQNKTYIIDIFKICKSRIQRQSYCEFIPRIRVLKVADITGFTFPAKKFLATSIHEKRIKFKIWIMTGHRITITYFQLARKRYQQRHIVVAAEETRNETDVVADPSTAAGGDLCLRVPRYRC